MLVYTEPNYQGARMRSESGHPARPIVDRRRAERRKNADRRAEVRWEPQKADRRNRGIAADRRKGVVWGARPRSELNLAVAAPI